MSFFTVLAALFARTSIIGGLAYAWSQRSAAAERWRVYRIPFASNQLRNEIFATLLIVVLDAIAFISIRRSGLIQYAESREVANMALSFVLLFVWLELWFYATHRFMHLPQLFWMHRHHHQSKVTNPLTALSFSLLDRASLVGGVLGFVVVLSHVYPIALGGLLLNGILNYVVNVAGHSNVEFVPEAVTRSAVGRWLLTPSYHSMHHARMHGNYGLFTTVLDRWFGTAHADYPEVYAHARAGQPLTRLNERLL